MNAWKPKALNWGHQVEEIGLLYRESDWSCKYLRARVMKDQEADHWERQIYQIALFAQNKLLLTEQ